LTGRKVPDGDPWYGVAAAGGVYVAPSYFDAIPVVASVRSLQDFPLCIEAAISQDEVLAGWRRERVWMILGGIVAAAFAVLLVRLFGLQLQRLALRNVQLDEARRQLDAAISNIPQGICFFDGKQRLIVSNRRFGEIYGLDARCTRTGTSLAELVDHWYAAGGPANLGREDYLMARAANLRAAKPHHYVIELIDGRTVAIQQQPMPDGGWVATHEDITARRQAEDKISFLARHDVLTGLPNRSMMLERIDQARRGARRGQGFAVLFLDLDRFKAVNDTLGHAAGDALLQDVAKRLQDTVREGDTVARFGGDEFVVLQANVPVPEAAATLAKRIIQAVGAPYRIGVNEVVVGASIGIDIANTDKATAGDLLRNADMALYIAKGEGRGIFRFFEPDMDVTVQNRHALERDLRCALERGEFTLHYQAIVDVRSGRPRGFEALLRWNHPARGLISPADFIPVAEETGLIIPIGEWALRRACADAAQWPSGTHISVNLSPIQFRSTNLVAAVRDSLVASGLPAQRLELEITESILLESNARNLAVMHEFRAAGIGIVMDDFGVGYSSLGTLRQFPFQRLKIDRCFVQDLGILPDSVYIVRAILGLCRDLDIGVVAEGVETEDQKALLLAEGCTDMQGYLFSRPKPATQLNTGRLLVAGPALVEHAL
jgi:diguanylate cyclase (GGDEF)-like protein